jgi:glyoxylase-like metal-dependent hydrolase (beta-lactamase superfamily II)
MRQKLMVRTRAVGSLQTNSYALVCPDSQKSVLIDPGGDPSELHEMLAGTQPEAIFITHTHHDHIGALDEMRAQLGVPVMASAGPYVSGVSLTVDRVLEDGDEVAVGEQMVQAIAAPGHTPDMLCYAVEGNSTVIVGDTVFDGGPGATRSVEDFQTTLRTLRTIVLAWPDETVCYPGHGPSFRLGDRRAAIETFLNRDHGSFYGDATWEMNA